MWVIVILHDGPATIEVAGDAAGRPFSDQQTAERAAVGLRRPGAAYSVYVVPVQKGPRN